MADAFFGVAFEADLAWMDLLVERVGFFGAAAP